MSRVARIGWGGLAVVLAASAAHAQDTYDLKPRFVEIHRAYRAADTATYTARLRATLRHARRLRPEQCLVYQGQLIDVGQAWGYDGLESLWLLYQDCAAGGSQESVGAARLANARRLRETLRFRAEPRSQLPIRVSHWGSAVERGTRGDAVRELLRHAARTEPSRVQRWSLHRLLADPAAQDALCALPVRLDQSGRVATSELFRRAGCLIGTSARPEDVCAGAFPQASGRSGTPPAQEPPLPGFSEDDRSRLQDLCAGLTGGGSPGSAGIDDLDAYSSDQCASEDTTRLYETEKIGQLVMDCYFSGSSSPVAIGGTSADIGRYLNVVIEYVIDDGTHGAALMVGLSHDDPGREFYGAYGATAEEARRALQDQLENDPPEGYTATRNDDGSTTLEGEFEVENEDGSTSRVKDTMNFDADGGVSRTRTTTNDDGTGRHEQSRSNADGSGSSTTLEWDKDGNVTKKTETTTDENGNTSTTTTEYEYDADGSVKSKKTTTTLPGEEGGFDPHNPACQELMGIEVMPGGSRSAFWSDVLGRPYRQDPRTVHPTPDQDPGTWGQEPFCGAPGLGSNTSRARCNLPVLCAPDSTLDDSCQCVQGVAGAIPLLGCATANCPEGTFPVPLGPNACSCQTGDSQDPGLPPQPLPDAQLVNGAFAEQTWNRSDGRIYVTSDMARGREVPGPR